MRTAFKAMAIILMAFLFMNFGGVVKYRPISWNGGSATATIIAAAGDTSDVFQMSNQYRINDSNQNRVPSALSWIMYATEGDNTDSTNATFYVDWSNDQTIWTVDTIGSVLASDATLPTVMSLKMTDNPQALFGRVRVFGAAASGDTMVVGGTLTKVFDE